MSSEPKPVFLSAIRSTPTPWNDCSADALGAVVWRTGPSGRPSLDDTQPPVYTMRGSPDGTTLDGTTGAVLTMMGMDQALYIPDGTSSNGQPEVNRVMCTLVPSVRWNSAQRLGPYMWPGARKRSL